MIEFSDLLNRTKSDLTFTVLPFDDIYSGAEQIPFKNRHPIFKALMKLEFEDAIRNHHTR